MAESVATQLRAAKDEAAVESIIASHEPAYFLADTGLRALAVARFPMLVATLDWQEDTDIANDALKQDKTGALAAALAKHGVGNMDLATAVRIYVTAQLAGVSEIDPTFPARVKYEAFIELHRGTPYAKRTDDVEFHCEPGSIHAYELLGKEPADEASMFHKNNLLIVDDIGSNRQRTQLPQFWWRDPDASLADVLVGASPATWRDRVGRWHICSTDSDTPLSTVAALALAVGGQFRALPDRKARQCATVAVPATNQEGWRSVENFGHNAKLQKSLAGVYRKHGINDFARWQRDMTTPFHDPLCHVVPMRFVQNMNAVEMHGAPSDLLTWCQKHPAKSGVRDRVVKAVSSILTQIVACCLEHDMVVVDLKLSNLAMLCDRENAYDVRLIDIDSIDVSAGSNATQMTYNSHVLEALKDKAPKPAYRQAVTLFAAAFTMLHLYEVLSPNGGNTSLINAHFITNVKARVKGKSVYVAQAHDAKLHKHVRNTSLPNLSTDWAAVMRLAVAALTTCTKNSAAKCYDHPQVVNFPATMPLLAAIRACNTTGWWYSRDGSELRVTEKGSVMVRQWGTPFAASASNSGKMCELVVEADKLVLHLHNNTRNLRGLIAPATASHIDDVEVERKWLSEP